MTKSMLNLSPFCGMKNVYLEAYATIVGILSGRIADHFCFFILNYTLLCAILIIYEFGC